MSVFLLGCAGLLENNGPAERIYWLEPYVLKQESVAAGSGYTLAISVSAVPGLNTDRLLVLEADARLNYYAAARWPDNLPTLVESLLRLTLESENRYSRVIAGTSAYGADHELTLELRESYSVKKTPGEKSSVRVALRGYVICRESDSEIKLQADIDVGKNRLVDIVSAYQIALDEVSLQLVNQLTTSCVTAESAT